MSTLSGIAPKGEKGRPKFQSLNINTLYRGESLETHQQKNVQHQRKHGMQNLGKIPAARRAPANLPSIKSEHSGNDPAYSLVPTGGSGWGSKPGETGPPPTPSTTPPSSTTGTPVQSSVSPSSQNSSNAAAGASAAVAAAAAAAAAVSAVAAGAAGQRPPVAATASAAASSPASSSAAPVLSPGQQLPPPVASSPAQQPQHQQQQPPHPLAVPFAAVGSHDKSWSAITSTSGGDAVPSFLAHQSPHFQAQFPLLPGETPPGGSSSSTSMSSKTDLTNPFGPGGPSLRPQTEGSWSQGGRPPPSSSNNSNQGQASQMGSVAGSQTQGSAAAQGHLPTGPDLGVMRNNSGQYGVGGGQGGPQQPNPHIMSQLRGVLPPFMLRHAGPFSPSFQGGPGPVHGPSRPRYPYMPDSRMMGVPRPSPGQDPDELTQRPIIKEEDLNRMDDIARDTGWATQDDIDYNQKLAFSDDETNADDDSPSAQKQQHQRNKQSPAVGGRQAPVDDTDRERDRDRDQRPSQQQQQQQRADVMEQQRRDEEDRRSADKAEQRGGPTRQHGGRPSPGSDYHGGPPPNMVAGGGGFATQPLMRNSVQGGRMATDEDELRREELAIAVEQAKQRAKQRKEVEEKRYEETKQAAAKKLLELNEKSMKNSSNSSSAAQHNTAAEGPLEAADEWAGPGAAPPPFRPNRKPADGPSFGQMTQISRRDYVGRALSDRDRERDRERDRDRDRDRDWERDRDRDRQRDRERDRDRDRDRDGDRDRDWGDKDRERERDRDLRPEREVGGGGHSGVATFSKAFKLPPRFQKQQQEQQQQRYFHQQSSRSSGGSGGASAGLRGRNRTESELSSDRERDEDRRGGGERERDRHTPDNYDGGRATNDAYAPSRGGDNSQRQPPPQQQQPPRDRDRAPGYGGKPTSGGGGSGGYYNGTNEFGGNSRGGGGYGGRNHDYESRSDWNDADREQRWDKKMDRERSRGGDRDHKDSYFYDSHRESDNKKSNDGYKLHGNQSSHQQQDTFDERDRDHQPGPPPRSSLEGDWRGERDRDTSSSEQSGGRDRRERPQRPDSRDSRASRDSRNSRDSIREESNRLASQSDSMLQGDWNDNCSYEQSVREDSRPMMRRKESRDEKRDMHSSYMPQRPIPGPITKEKLEASESRSEMKRSNLIQLGKKTDQSKQKNEADRKQSVTNDGSSDAWSRASSAHAAANEAPRITSPGNAHAPVSDGGHHQSWADVTDDQPPQHRSAGPASSASSTSIHLDHQDNKIGIGNAKDDADTLQADNAHVGGDGASTDKQSHQQPPLSNQQKTDNQELTSIKKSDDLESNMNHRPVAAGAANDQNKNRGGGSNRSGGGSSWGGSFKTSQWSSQRGVGSGSESRGGGGRRGGGGGGRGGGGGPRSQQRNWTSGAGPNSDVSDGSADEVSASAESPKDDKDRNNRRNAPRSPKQSNRRNDNKDEKSNRDRDNRERDAKRDGGGNEKIASGGDGGGRRMDSKRSGYEGGPRSSGMGGGGGREGFVPRGEPSRFGRGMHHGGGGGRSAGGGNMTYGPPSSGKFQSKDAIDKDKPTKEEEQHNDIDKAKTSNQGPPSSAIGSRQVGGSKTSSQVDSSSRYQSRGAKENDQRRGGGGDPRKTRGGGRGRQSQAPGGGGQDGGDDDEVWEETMSEEGEGEREDGGGKQVDTRQQRNYHSSRTSSGRGARRTEGRRGGGAGGGDKRSYDRSGSDSRAANQQPQVINGRVGGGGGKGSKDSADKSSSNESALSDATNRRTDSNKDKNNLDGIDLLSSSVVVVDDQPEGAYEEDGSLFAADSGAGFNEVRNKKNAKQQRQQQQQLTNQKSADEKSGGGTNREQRGGGGGKNERFKSNKVYGGGNSNSPTPQDGPKADGRSSMRGGGGQNRESQSGGGSGKSYGNRNKKQMIPRFHQQANQQQQQQQAAYDVNEMNKINQNVSMFNVKDVSAAAPPAVNAWDKPITSSILLDTRVQMAAIGFNKTEANSNVIVDNCVEIGDHGQSGGSSQRSSPGGMSGQTSEKMLNKLSREAIEKSAVDGSTPVPSLIFENTNLKGNTDPGKLKFKNPRIDKNRDRKLDGIEDNSSMGGLGGYKPATASGVEMLNQDASGNSKPDPIQMPMSFAKNQEDSADFCADKLDFFDSELSQLTADTADKPTSSSSSQSCKSATMQLMQRTHQQHAALQQLSAPSSTAELNLKIQSVKKVWDGPGPVGSVMDHHGEDGGGVVSSAPAFTTTFGNAVDDSPHYQVKSVDNVGNVVSNDPDGPGGTEIVYSVSQCHAVSGGVNSYVNAQNMMKPDAINSVSSNVCKLIDPQVKPQPAGVTAMSASATHALSPPPALTSGYSSNTQQPNSHIFQYAGGMSGIPSPPTVVYNTSQPIQGQTTEMYQPTFQLSSAPVLGQSRSQFSPFPPYSLTNQSLYFPTAAPPPPSSAGPPPPADMFQPAHSSMHQPSPYQQMGRQMGPPPATPFGPSSHSNMNSSSTGQLLISSATGSGHMPPVVPKQAPPQQPIGTIGTKPYQPTANPMFVYESMPFMSSSLLQRSTAAVGAQMQAAAAAAASNSYYSAAATAGVPPAGPPPPQPQSGSFYNPAAANANSSQTLHQQQYSAATVQFGQSQNASAANPPVGMQNYGSQLFRQQAPSSYLKSSSLAQQHVGNDPSKSPSANQSDVMNSVFQASQMQSPKSRPAGTVGKQACQPQQPSPTQSHHKYNTAYQILEDAFHYKREASSAYSLEAKCIPQVSPVKVMQQQVAVAQQQHVAAAAAAQQQRNSAAAVAAAQMGGRPGGQVGVPPPTQQQVPPPTRYNPTIQPPIQRPPANYQVVKMQQQMNNANNNNGNLQQQQHHHNNNGRLPPPQNRHPQQQGRPGGPPPPTAYVTKMTPNNANSYYPGQPGGGVKMDSSGSVMESKTDQVCKMPDNAASKSQTGLADLPKDDNATVTAD